MECWGELRDAAHGWSGLAHRGWARPNLPRKGGRQLGFHLDLKVALGGCRALGEPGTLPSAAQVRTRESLSLTVSAGGLRSNCQAVSERSPHIHGPRTAVPGPI